MYKFVAMNKVYTVLKSIRSQKGLSQDDVAEKIGMTQGNYARLERGQTQLTIERLEQIADVFEMSVGALVNFEIGEDFDYKEDVAYYYKLALDKDKTIAKLKKELSEYENTNDEIDSIFFKENEDLKAKNKSLNDKIKALEEKYTLIISQKDELIQEKEKSLLDKVRIIETLEKMVSILEKNQK